MKLGIENRTTTILALVLFVIAVFLLVRMFSSGGQPAAAATANVTLASPATAAQPLGRRRSPVRGRAPAGHAGVAQNLPLDPRLRLDLLKQSEDTRYTGNGRNIFRAEAEIPKPVAPPVKEAQKPPPPPVPQGPPPPPPINLKFFGFASQPGEPTRVFLGQGDDVFIASEGDIINRRYKILKISPKSVEVLDVLSNNRQTIPLTAG